MQTRCGDSQLPFPSDRVLAISEVDDRIEMYKILCDPAVCSRALRALSETAGGAETKATVHHLRILASVGSVHEVQCAIAQTPNALSDLVDAIGTSPAVAIVDIAFRTRSSQSAHAVAVVFGQDGAVVVDPNGARPRRRGRVSTNDRMIRALRLVLDHHDHYRFDEDVYPIAALDTPNVNFSPKDHVTATRRMGLHKPAGLDLEGYCFVISMLFLFDSMCTGDLFARSQHVRNWYDDLHNDPLRLMLYGRAFLSSLFRLMMRRCRTDGEPPSWWPPEYRFVDVRRYDDRQVAMDGDSVRVVVD